MQANGIKKSSSREGKNRILVDLKKVKYILSRLISGIADDKILGEIETREQKGVGGGENGRKVGVAIIRENRNCIKEEKIGEGEAGWERSGVS